MPYIIDGHNLIGALPDISLRDEQDERQLISRLQAFLSRSRKRAVVFFDRRAPGSRGSLHTPNAQVRFIAHPRTADDAIRDYVMRLGREAPNWTVVSSDRALRDLARRAGARSMTSQEFSALMAQAHPADSPKDSNKPPAPSSKQEIAAWERLFNENRDE
jgi:predicted RNA-binding protein with PIN domain